MKGGAWSDMNKIFEEKNLGTLAEKQGGWKRELNLVAWNGADAKYDIRDWSPDHQKMGRGITLTDDEMERLVYAMGGRA